MSELPATSDDITAEWLNDVLDDSAKGGAEVTSIEKEVIGQGAGFVGELTRLNLTYDGTAPDAPQSLIAKWPTRDEEVRAMIQLVNAYEREVRFYEQLATDTPLRTPRCYYHYTDALTASYALLLEDLAGRPGDQLATCSIDEAKTALQALASFHAAWWESPKLKELAWMPGTDDQMLIGLLAMLYNQAIPTFTEQFADQLDPEIVRMAKQFGEKLPELAADLNDRPLTIVHTDYRLDNMFFDLDDGSPIAIIDWQLAQRGPCMMDVGYFLSGNLTTEARLEHQEELVHDYFEALVEHGVKDVTYEQCYEDYRASALFLFIFLVTGRENIDIDNYPPRARELIETMMLRYTTAILDLDAAEFFPD